MRQEDDRRPLFDADLAELTDKLTRLGSIVLVTWIKVRQGIQDDKFRLMRLDRLDIFQPEGRGWRTFVLGSTTVKSASLPLSDDRCK